MSISCKNCGKPTTNKNYCCLSCANGHLAIIRGEKRKHNYEKNPSLCKCCSKPLRYEQRMYDYCDHSCAAQINNSKFPKRKLKDIKFVDGKKIIISKPFPICENCGNSCKTHKSKFCSEKCSGDSRRKETDRKIECGESTRQMRRYLIEKRGEKCELCGWDKKNPITNKVPLDMDHIDGNSDNNLPINLRLICPNCHSLTPTYKNLNKGNGRASRLKRYHAGKSY